MTLAADVRARSTGHDVEPFFALAKNGPRLAPRPQRSVGSIYLAALTEWIRPVVKVSAEV